MIITVNTPQGVKRHGTIQESKGKKYFCRTVDSEKDRMRIFDAYSLHPDALISLRREKVSALIYRETPSQRRLGLRMDHLEAMLDGRMNSPTGKRLAWEAEFAGGPTIYIKIDAFTVIP